MIKIAKAIRDFFIAFFTTFFSKWLEDVFILAGIGLIVVNTYLITVVETNVLSGNYLSGIILVLIGVVLARK